MDRIAKGTNERRGQEVPIGREKLFDVNVCREEELLLGGLD